MSSVHVFLHKSKRNQAKSLNVRPEVFLGTPSHSHYSPPWGGWGGVCA